MTILGIVALVAIVIIGVMVLRVKSDPTEKEAVRRVLEEEKAKSASVPVSGSEIDSKPSKS